MYEHRKQKPISSILFARRLFKQSLWVAAILAVSLGVGMLGYATLENMPLIDAFLNSAMLLGGMGPVNEPQSVGGKLFAGFYALYAGLVFIVTAALLLTPVLHRLLHRFHWDQAQ